MGGAFDLDPPTSLLRSPRFWTFVGTIMEKTEADGDGILPFHLASFGKLFLVLIFGTAANATI